MPQQVVDITYELLKEGHFVNITTNGTLTKRFDELLRFPKEYLERLHFAFSFHYLELLPDKLDRFFQNIAKVRDAGCSFLVQVNLIDEYLPHLNAIRDICLDRVGAIPQIVATRKETDLASDVQFFTKYSKDEYSEFGQSFHSPLFDFTMGNLGVRRTQFCYAGDWSATLNLATGVLTRCYASAIKQNIFENPDQPIRFRAVGKNCRSLFCFNASHFMALGVIPSVPIPTYAELRNREEGNWYSLRMKSFLSQKLYENNQEYSFWQRIETDVYAVKDSVLSFRTVLGGVRRRVFATLRKVKNGKEKNS